MITVTVSGEQGCGKTQFVEWLTYLLQNRVKNKTVSFWHVKEIVEVQEKERVSGVDPVNTKSYPHYFKSVPANQTHVDVYWVLEAWQTSNPIGHAVKKLLCAGHRGSKDRAKDLMEAIASIQRALELEGL